MKFYKRRNKKLRDWQDELIPKYLDKPDAYEEADREAKRIVLDTICSFLVIGAFFFVIYLVGLIS